MLVPKIGEKWENLEIKAFIQNLNFGIFKNETLSKRIRKGKSKKFPIF